MAALGGTRMTLVGKSRHSRSSLSGSEEFDLMIPYEKKKQYQVTK